MQLLSLRLEACFSDQKNKLSLNDLFLSNSLFTAKLPISTSCLSLILQPTVIMSPTSTATQTALPMIPPLFDKSSGLSSSPFCSTSAESDPIFLPLFF